MALTPTQTEICSIAVRRWATSPRVLTVNLTERIEALWSSGKGTGHLDINEVLEVLAEAYLLRNPEVLRTYLANDALLK